MTRRFAIRAVLIAAVVFGAFGCGGGAGGTANSCPGYIVNVVPEALPPFSCGEGDALVGHAIEQIDTFWNSKAVACACQSDAPARCSSNAFAPVNAPGYLFYDPQLLQFVELTEMSFLPPAIILAHEFGHDIQYAYNLTSSVGILNELGADCLSGYFLGWLECQGMVNINDVQAVYMNTCNHGDMMGLPWYDPSAHGTCEQRVSAVMTGVNGYSATIDPTQQCRPSQ